jgi:hypothetical protein
MARAVEAVKQVVENGGPGGGGNPEEHDAILTIGKLLEGVLQAHKLEELPGLVQKLGEAAVGEDAKASLMDQVLKKLSGKEAQGDLQTHGVELVAALRGGDKERLRLALDKVMGGPAQRTQEAGEAEVAIFGWFEAVGKEKGGKLAEVQAKTAKIEEKNETKEAQLLGRLSTVGDLPEDQKSVMMDEAIKHGKKLKEREFKNNLKVIAPKLKDGAAKVTGIMPKDFQKKIDYRLLAEAVEQFGKNGDLKRLSKSQLNALTEKGEMLDTIDVGGGQEKGEEQILGRRVKVLLREGGFEEEEQDLILEVIKKGEEESRVRRAMTQVKMEHKARMGTSDGLDESELREKVEKYMKNLNDIDELDNVPNMTPEQLMARMRRPGQVGMSGERLLGKITNEEFKSYLVEDADGYLRVRPEMIDTENKKQKFKELYMDMAMQAARKMFNTRVNQQGMDVYYDQNAQEYISIKAIQGIWDLDDSIIDHVKTKTMMLYLGDAMEGGYHDPKEMMQILGGVEKSGKYFMNTLRRSEGLYFTNERGEKQQICRLDTFDLQKMVEQTCAVDSVYPPEAGRPGSVERRRWLTMLLRENDVTKHGALDGAFLAETIKNKAGDEAWNGLTQSQQAELMKNYNTMVKDAILYEAVTDRIGECFENASFGKDEHGNVIFNLWQRIPEMWMKNSRAGVRFFILKYGAINMLEFVQVMDTILPSYFLYRHETMAHMTDKKVAGKMFFGVPGEGETVVKPSLKEHVQKWREKMWNKLQRRDVVPEAPLPPSDIEKAKKYGARFAKVMENAIVTWHLGDVESEWMEFGIRGRKDTAMRRANGEVTAKLRALDLRNTENLAMINAMDYTAFTKATGIEIRGSTQREKWDYFVDNYGDGYYNNNASPAKGWPDWVGKFAGEKTWDNYETQMAWGNNPQDTSLQIKMWRNISSYTKPDEQWHKYHEWMTKRGKTDGVLGYHMEVKRDGGGLTMWQTAEGQEDTALPIPQMRKKFGAESVTDEFPWKNQIEAETKYETPNIDVLLHQAHKDLAKAGFAMVKEKWGERTKQKLVEFATPYRNGYMNFPLGFVLSPIRLLKELSGFHDYAEFWAWILSPLPGAWDALAKIFGVKEAQGMLGSGGGHQ